MIEVTIAEAKMQFSKLVKLANQGEGIFVTSGRQRKPIARSVAAEPVSSRGLSNLGPGFFEPLPEEELRLWNGEGE